MSRADRVLFISPAFFGYERSICAELRSRGLEVDFIDERPSNTAIARAVLRVLPRLLRGTVDRYFASVLRTVAERKYEFVIVVKGETIPASFLRRLRLQNPKARFVFYSFDAVQNSSNCVTLFPFFDRLFTFDYVDSEKFDELTYKPLFYAPEFAIREAIDSRPIDLSFVGTLHSGRYEYVKALFGRFPSTSGFFYVPARWLFFLDRLSAREYAGVDIRDVSFSKMGRDEVAQLFRNSKAVFDLQRTGQTGLTMRTFEVLAAGAILITTNVSIERESFFDPERIVLLRDLNAEEAAPLIHEALSRSVLDGSPPVGFDRFSLSEWTRTLLI